MDARRTETAETRRTTRTPRTTHADTRHTPAPIDAPRLPAAQADTVQETHHTASRRDQYADLGRAIGDAIVATVLGAAPAPPTDATIHAGRRRTTATRNAAGTLPRAHRDAAMRQTDED